jgi:hypothetical protein
LDIANNDTLWRQDLTHFEAIVAALFFQFTLYIGLRLAHRGFTLGELGLVCFGGTVLCLETLNLTIARVRGHSKISISSADISITSRYGQ